MSLTLTSTQTKEGIVVIEAEGTIKTGDDFEKLKEMREMIGDFISRGCKDFILVAKRLTYIDSNGWSAILTCQIMAKNRAGQIVLAQLSEQDVNNLIALRLIDIFTICGTREEALEALRKVNTSCLEKKEEE